MPNNWYHTPKYNNTTQLPKQSETKVVASVKRKAIVGEKIVITEKHFASDFMIGDIFTVKEIGKDSVNVNEDAQGVYHWEYEVITKFEQVYE